MTDPITLACSAPDYSRWLLIALGLTNVVTGILLAFGPHRRKT